MKFALNVTCLNNGSVPNIILTVTLGGLARLRKYGLGGSPARL